MCSCMIEKSSILPRKSSVMFGNARQPSKNSENVRKRHDSLVFGQLWENLQRFQKVYGNPRRAIKKSALVDYIINQQIIKVRE